MSSIPSTSHDSYFAELLRNARTALMDRGNYLGGPDTFTKLVWWGERNSHRLVNKADADAADDAIKAHSEDDHAPGASPPPSALLSVIGFVPSEDYWLTSCGMWKGPTTAAPNFADAKATCTIEDAKLEVLGDDFKHALSNVQTLIESGSTPGYNVSKGPHVKSSTGTFKLKFRHVLFEVCLFCYMHNS
jgi:hypothetical protein